MLNNCGHVYSDNALRRMRSRGVRSELVEELIRWADRDVSVGNGCQALSLSRTSLTQLIERRDVPPSHSERLSKVVAVVRTDTETGELIVLTVLHDTKTRRYRRLN